MSPLKKRRNASRLPLALNPQKSKDVLAVLAERNQAIVPVGAWVEPASPHSSEIPAYTSAYIIEEELKEQLRKKQEALKHFQRQVKHRVNQQIRLRKRQQLQKSYEAAEKESCIAMLSSDPEPLTSTRSVFPDNSNAAIGSARSPPSQMLGDRRDDGEGQNQLIQQAQALSQRMKQARLQLASFKAVSEKYAVIFPHVTGKSSPTQEESDYEEPSSITNDKKGRENLLQWNQQDFLSEEKNKTSRRVQFKNPLLAVREEENLKSLQLHVILPETQDYLPEAQGDLLETQGDLTGVQNTESHTQAVEREGQPVEGQAVEPKAQAIKIGPRSIMLKAQSFELEDGNILEVQDYLTPNQAFLPKDQNIVPTCQDQNILPNKQNILLKCQDQQFLCKDQHVFSKDQNIQPKCHDQGFIPKCPDQDFIPKDQHILATDQNILLKFQHQHFLPRDQCVLTKDQCAFSKEQSTLRKDQDQDFLPRYQATPVKGSFDPQRVTTHRLRTAALECHYVNPQGQDQASPGDQSLYSRQQPSVETAERWRDLPLDGHRRLPPKPRREASSRRQVYDKYQSGLDTEFRIPLAFQFGINQEEDKKERQKQYLRYRRLFMDIEREQVKEQQRQKEYRKRIEKIKKKKEQQRYAEELKILRINLHEDPHSEEKMSEMLAQLRLQEIKGVREKRQQRGKEYQRYVEALRAQIQEKMQLYDITLPPLCGCGPGFWDAHPDTCANNCIFYKNHRAYTRALQSVINSCDIPGGNASLRSAIHNFASAHRRALKNV